MRNTTTKANYFCQASIALLLMLLLSSCASLTGPRKCYLGSFSGRMLDMETGKPIEGAVAHVTYVNLGASGAGAIASPVAVREAVTDADGEFFIQADTVLHKCFSGKMEGRFQLLKPGYGYRGEARKTCPDEKLEKTPWPDGCYPTEGRYVIWELPKLKTAKERRNNLHSIHRASGTLFFEQPELLKAINKERFFLGLPPL